MFPALSFENASYEVMLGSRVFLAIIGILDAKAALQLCIFLADGIVLPKRITKGQIVFPLEAIVFDHMNMKGSHIRFGLKYEQMFSRVFIVTSVNITHICQLIKQAFYMILI